MTLAGSMVVDRFDWRMDMKKTYTKPTLTKEQKLASITSVVSAKEA